jgi:hypothetical protein
MIRTLRKFVRDALVTGIGAAILYLADNATALDLPPDVAAVVGVISLAVYRMLRDRFDTLAEVDRIG